MKNNENKMKKKFSPFYTVLCVLIAFYSITIIAAIYFMFVTAFKTQLEWDLNHWFIPGAAKGSDGFTFENLTQIFTSYYKERGYGKTPIYLAEMAMNSVVYSIGSSFFAALVPCVMAYFSAKFDYKFSGVIYATVIAVMIIPVVGSMPATIKMLKTTGLYNKMISAFVLKGTFVSMYFLVFYAAFKGVPKDYTEAAYIDGASELRIMVNVIMPLVKTTFLTVFLIFFVDFWNDYQTPVIYIPAKQTLAGYIRSLSTGGSNIWMWNEATQKFDASLNQKLFVGVEMAGCFIIAAPTLTIFCVFRNRLMGNLSMGGIKG